MPKIDEPEAEVLSLPLTERARLVSRLVASLDQQADRDNEDELIDESLLECFLDLGLKERIQSAANYANAVERLRRLRPAPASH